MAFAIGKPTSPPSNPISRTQQNLPTGDQFKQKILIQNKALAKKNSVLMTKIADLETRISELIQNNIELRALNAKSEDQKRKWFEEKLNIIEEGVSQRFEEMFQMFSTIRSNEGLNSSKVNLLNVINNASSNESSSDKTVSFQNIKSPRSTSSSNPTSRSERRRKSARRQSIYIPSPSSSNSDSDLKSKSTKLDEDDDSNKVEVITLEEFDSRLEKSNDEDDNNDNIKVHYDETNPFQEQFDSNTEQQQQEISQIIDDFSIPEENEDIVQEVIEDSKDDDISHATSLSPIKFSSPRLEETKKTKFLVYNDLNNDDDDGINDTSDFELKVQRLAKESIKNIRSNENDDIYEVVDKQKPLSHVADKVKLTNSKKQRQKSFKDEEMPESIASSKVLSTRKSRTRGKQISYAEPSLRMKMRRQSEKLVDAVVDDAFPKFTPDDLKYETSMKLPSSPERTTQEKSQQSIEIFEDTNAGKEEPLKKIDKPTILDKIKPLIEQDSVNITRRRKPLSALKQNPNKVAKRDFKPMNKLQKDDFNDEEEESDLSVFDLVEESAVGVPKTYKTKPDLNPKRKNNRRHSMLL